MGTIQQKMKKLIEKNNKEPFWETNQLDYMETVYEFFETFDVDLDDVQLNINEQTEFLDSSNVQRSKAVLEIPEYSIRIALSAFYDRKWYYSFAHIDDMEGVRGMQLIPIQEEMKTEIKGKACVLYFFECPAMGNQLYAIPIDVAETLNIQQYDRKEIGKNEGFLDQINPYQLPFYQSYNTE